MSDADKKETIHLFGDFKKAHVFIGDGGLLGHTKSLKPEVFDSAFHDETYKGVKYRFINPEKTPESVHIDGLKSHQDSFVFEGDLDGMMIEVTSGGIRSQFVEELKGTRDEPEGPSSSSPV